MPRCERLACPCGGCALCAALCLFVRIAAQLESAARRVCKRCRGGKQGPCKQKTLSKGEGKASASCAACSEPCSGAPAAAAAMCAPSAAKSPRARALRSASPATGGVGCWWRDDLSRDGGWLPHRRTHTEALVTAAPRIRVIPQSRIMCQRRSRDSGTRRHRPGAARCGTCLADAATRRC